MEYITSKVYGLPKPKRQGFNTGSKHRRKEYVHKVNIRGYDYFKVHIARSTGECKIKYFKTFKEASLFVDMVKVNPYL
jgi:hypothetical protein